MGSRWKVTRRVGPEVGRTGFSRLEDALAETRRQAEEILATAPLDEAKAIRDYPPEKRTKGRIEISGKGLLRPPTAGIDIRGDNSVVGYTGMVNRRALKAKDLNSLLRELEEILQA